MLSPVYIFVFPSWSPAPNVKILQKLKAFDWVGAVLNGAVFVLVMIALTFSGSVYPWGSGAAIALWVIWGVTLIAFCLQQYFSLFTTPEHRIFPVHFLKSRDFVLLFIATSCSAAAMAFTLYYLPLFFAFTRGDSALDAAVRLLPFVIFLIVSTMAAGATLPMVGRYAPYYTIGGALALAGSALMFTVRADTSTARLYGFSILIGAGTGFTFQNAYAVMATKVGDNDKAAAIGFLNVAQVGTIALALSIAACLFENLGFNFLRDALASQGVPEPFFRLALAGTDSSVFSAFGPQVTADIVSTVAFTIARIFGMGIAAGALMLVVSLLMRQEKINLSAPAENPSDV